MGIMADRAILPDRLMLYQKWSPFLGMTLIAGIVDGVLH
jgi:hypothetical protein